MKKAKHKKQFLPVLVILVIVFGLLIAFTIMHNKKCSDLKNEFTEFKKVQQAEFNKSHVIVEPSPQMLSQAAECRN